MTTRPLTIDEMFPLMIVIKKATSQPSATTLNAGGMITQATILPISPNLSASPIRKTVSGNSVKGKAVLFIGLGLLGSVYADILFIKL